VGCTSTKGHPRTSILRGTILGRDTRRRQVWRSPRATDGARRRGRRWSLRGDARGPAAAAYTADGARVGPLLREWRRRLRRRRGVLPRRCQLRRPWWWWRRRSALPRRRRATRNPRWRRRGRARTGREAHGRKPHGRKRTRRVERTQARHKKPVQTDPVYFAISSGVDRRRREGEKGGVTESIVP
jgi:hypothetical protein